MGGGQEDWPRGPELGMGAGGGREDWPRGPEVGARGAAGRVEPPRAPGSGGGTGTRCGGNGGDHEGGRVELERKVPTARRGGNPPRSPLTSPKATSIARSLLDSTLAIANPLLRGPSREL
jgi:hypothetical protein